jgi:hypothetical protein
MNYQVILDGLRRWITNRERKSLDSKLLHESVKCIERLQELEERADEN